MKVYKDIKEFTLAFVDYCEWFGEIGNRAYNPATKTWTERNRIIPKEWTISEVYDLFIKDSEKRP